MITPIHEWSMRMDFAKAARNLGAEAAKLAEPNEAMRKAIARGMLKLTTKIQKDRFTGQGPFPVSQRKLGVVSGRLRRDIHATDVEQTADGYSARIGSSVSYFATHELGFEGYALIPSHRRAAHTNRGRKIGESMVAPHTRRISIPQRAPMRAGIEQHAEETIGKEIETSLRAQYQAQGGAQ